MLRVCKGVVVVDCGLDLIPLGRSGRRKVLGILPQKQSETGGIRPVRTRPDQKPQLGSWEDVAL